MQKNKYLLSLSLLAFSLGACAGSDALTSGAKPQGVDKTTIFSEEKPLFKNQKLDFDGDKKADTVAWVVIANQVSLLPKPLLLATPWPRYEETDEKSHQFKHGSKNNLLVTLANQQQILIHDVNSVSILDTEAAQEVYIVAHHELTNLELPELVTQAKGDVIALPTEAGIDVYLFWNGTSFNVYEPLELP